MHPRRGVTIKNVGDHNFTFELLGKLSLIINGVEAQLSRADLGLVIPVQIELKLLIRVAVIGGAVGVGSLRMALAPRTPAHGSRNCL